MIGPLTTVVNVIVKRFCIETGSFFFLRLRFLGDAPFDKSWRVTVRDLGNLQVDFFKSQAGQERKRSLCTLHIMPKTPVLVLFVFSYSTLYICYPLSSTKWLNRPFYSCLLNNLAFEWQRGWR